MAPALRRDIIQTLTDAWREHGDVVRLRSPFASVPDYLLVHPDHIKHVLQDRHTNYRHPPLQRKKFGQVVGDGLVASQADYWMRQRRLMQPAFHRERVAGFAELTVNTIDEMLERWQPYAESGRPLDMRIEMMRVTLDVVARALFSAQWSAQVETMGQQVTDLLEYAFSGMLSPVDVPEGVPLPANRRFRRARDAIDAVVYPLITQRRRTGVDDGSLLSMLIRARDEETGQQMTDRQVRDEVMAMLIAGHETVSTGLTWTWYLLSKHPDMARQIQAEADVVLGSRAPTAEDLPRLRYTAMVIQEAMRLYPPLWVMGRMPVEDDEVGGWRIPAGSVILLCQYVTHRHPEFWDNPEGFDPLRFEPDRIKERHRYAYFAFGGGPRKCIGAGFAMMEMPLVVARVAQHHRLDLVPGHPIALQPGISLRARHGMLMILSPPVHSVDGGPARRRQVAHADEQP